MPIEVNHILKMYHQELNKIFKDRLENVILYGSYARGDYTKESDIDILALVNVKPEEIDDYSVIVSDTTYDFNEKYNTDIMPIVQSIDIYSKWKDIYPFYKNIEREGITVV